MATKISVSTLLSHLAIAADISVSEVASGQVETYNGPKNWKYKTGGYDYLGPVDCSGLIVAIARKAYDSNYAYKSPDDFNTLMGAGDISTMPDKPGIFLYRPKNDTQSRHVGIYTGMSNNNKYTIEAFDTTYNVARRGNRLLSAGFTRWGYLDFVQY